jgi:hypothetical protein
MSDILTPAQIEELRIAMDNAKAATTQGRQAAIEADARAKALFLEEREATRAYKAAVMATLPKRPRKPTAAAPVEPAGAPSTLDQ